MTTDRKETKSEVQVRPTITYTAIRVDFERRLQEEVINQRLHKDEALQWIKEYKYNKGSGKGQAEEIEHWESQLKELSEQRFIEKFRKDKRTRDTSFVKIYGSLKKIQSFFTRSKPLSVGR